MKAKTQKFIKRILETNANTTCEEFISLHNELLEYLKTVSEEEADEFAQSGYGEMLRMCCPPEAIALPPEAFLD